MAAIHDNWPQGILALLGSQVVELETAKAQIQMLSQKLEEVSNGSQAADVEVPKVREIHAKGG